jgi:hypothetical protein
MARARVGEGVSKRRFRPPEERDGEDTAPGGSAEERRRERKRLRAAREAGNVRAAPKGNLLRRALVFGIPAAVVVVIVVVLLVNPFQPPCLQLQTIPSASGVPAFPSHNQSTDLTTSWCPPGVTPVLQAYPLLKVRIQSNDVGLPTAIGRNQNYTYQGAPYTCTLPVSTATVAQGGLAPNTIYLISPWPYIYTLGDFFQVWGQSYSTVNVNASFPSQPIRYTSNDLLGFTADSTHSITLWIDNSPSSAGPNLNLDTLTSVGTVYPSCLGKIYGTNHAILLSYSSNTASPAAQRLSAPGLVTGLAPDSPASPWDGSASHFHTLTTELIGLGFLHLKSLDWLLLRGTG